MKKRNLNSRQLRLMSVGLLASSAVLSVADSAPIVAKEKKAQDTQSQDEQEAVTILSSTTEETEFSKETIASETVETTTTTSFEGESTSTEETVDSSTTDSTSTTDTTDSSTTDSSTTDSSTTEPSTSGTSSSNSSTTSSSSSSTSTSTSTSKPQPVKPKPQPQKPSRPNRPTWVGSVNNNVQGPVQPATPSYPVTGNVVQGVGNGNETISVSPNLTTKAFINVIGEDAREIAGTNNLYASVMIAQAILESASGNSTLAAAPNYNLFGIKGNYKGASANFLTSEDNGSGSMYTIRSDFRKYPSYKESLEDYVKLLRGGTDFNNDFYSGTWKSNTKSHKDATRFLTGKYATDTSYAAKLNGLIDAYDLTQYDELKDKSTNKKDDKDKTISSLEKKIDKKDKKQEENIEFITHIVKKGDSLKSISELYNISTLAILEKNQLDRRMLFIGQTLKIPKQEIKVDEIRKEEVVDRSFEMAQKLSNAFSGRTTKTSTSSGNSSKTMTSSTTSSSVTMDSSPESSTTSSSRTVDSTITSSSSTTESSTIESSTTNSTTRETASSRDSYAENETTDSSSDYKVSATRTKTKNTYEVKEGDTLASISKKTGVSIWSLKEWNSLDQYFLTEGQLLVLSPVYDLDA